MRTHVLAPAFALVIGYCWGHRFSDQAPPQTQLNPKKPDVEQQATAPIMTRSSREGKESPAVESFGDLDGALARSNFYEAFDACEFAQYRFINVTIPHHAKAIIQLENAKEAKAEIDKRCEEFGEKSAFWLGRGTLVTEGQEFKIEISLEAMRFNSQMLGASLSQKAKEQRRLTAQSRISSGEQLSTIFFDSAPDDMYQINGNYYLSSTVFKDPSLGPFFSLILVPFPQFGGGLEYMLNRDQSWQISNDFKWEPMTSESWSMLSDRWNSEYNEQLERDAIREGRPPPRMIEFTREPSADPEASDSRDD